MDTTHESSDTNGFKMRSKRLLMIFIDMNDTNGQKSTALTMWSSIIMILISNQQILINNFYYYYYYYY